MVGDLYSEQYEFQIISKDGQGPLEVGLHGKEPAAHWTYDFGKGPVEGAYGPLFIRLSTPGFKGIGIHGTHDPATVPGRETHGCIRMKNDDLVKLSKCVDKGTVVVILPSRTYVLATLSKKENTLEKLFMYK